MVEFAHLTGDRQNVSGILRNTIWLFLLEKDKNPQFTLKKKIPSLNENACKFVSEVFSILQHWKTCLFIHIGLILQTLIS